MKSLARDILVFGYYGEGNFGDDLLAYYVLDLLCNKVSPERIIVRAPGNSYLMKWFPGILCVPSKEIFRSPLTQSIRKFIFGGGGLFFSFPPASIRNIWGFRKAKAYQYNRLGGKAWRHLDTYAFCVGVGPLEGVGARWITRKFIQKFQHISVRDNVSKNILVKCGIKKVSVVSDPSIGLARAIPQKVKRNHKSVGIVIRSWNMGSGVADLIASLQLVAKHFRKQGGKVKFISFHSGHDTEVLNMLRENDENVREWNSETETILEFFKYLSQYQILITMRAHGVYAGSLLGAVPLTINIEPKLAISAKKCGYQDYVIPENASWDQIVDIAEQAIANGPVHRNWNDDIRLLDLESDNLVRWLQT